MLGTGQAHADKIVQSQTQPDLSAVVGHTFQLGLPDLSATSLRLPLSGICLLRILLMPTLTEQQTSGNSLFPRERRYTQSHT